MDAKLALELLSPIPAKDFIVELFSNGKDKCCAVGHLVRLTSKNPKSYRYEDCTDFSTKNEAAIKVKKFRQKTEEFLLEKYDIPVTNIAVINNRKGINGFNQRTPKARVIAFLKEMIKAGY